MMIFSETSTKTLPLKNPKNPKDNPETWYVKEKLFDKNLTYYISLKRSLKVLFNVVIFEVVD